MGDETLRRSLESAFTAPSDFPDARLLSRTMAAITRDAASPTRSPGPVIRLPRTAAQLLAATLIFVLCACAVGLFFALNRTPAPVAPINAPVIFPTKMFSGTAGWAVTSRGSAQQVWRTSDGGRTWKDSSPQSSGPQSFTSANYFLDRMHAWVATVSVGSAGTSFTTQRTIDGGKTWRRGAPVSLGFIPNTPVMDFVDANVGWLVVESMDLTHPAGPDVYASVDGGVHWALVGTNVAQVVRPGEAVLVGGAGATFISGTTGWVTVGLAIASNNNSFFRNGTAVVVTHDGGRTWHAQLLPVAPSQNAYFDPPQFFDKSNGVMLLDDSGAPVPKSVLLSTSDGGANWTAHPLAWEWILSLQFVDPQHGWAVAGPASDFAKQSSPRTIPLPLYRTDDGGAHWTRVDSNLDLTKDQTRLTDLEFADQRTGFATFWGFSGPTQLFESTDGGHTWVLIAVCEASVGNQYPPPVCPAR